MNNLVSIIIVSWNGRKWIKNCLESIEKQTYKNYEVVFVDNNSSDDSIPYIKKNYPYVKIIKNNRNLGFGVANNIGIKHCNGDMLFLLNNDTEFSPNTLEDLLKFKKEQHCNIVGPRLLNTEKDDPLDGGYMQMDILGSPGKGSLFYIEGCALMILKKDFYKLGGFDDKYFMYAEDIDLCWRANLYGFKLGVCENVQLIHYGGGSSHKTQIQKGEKHTSSLSRRYWVECYTLRNLLKNYGLTATIVIVPIYIIQNICESIIYLISGNIKLSIAIWKSFIWNIQNLPDTINKRNIIQKNRRINDYFLVNRMHLGSYKLEGFLKFGLPNFK